MRQPGPGYADPVDALWVGLLRRLGLRLRRGPGAYASTDGKGELLVAPPEDLDADDCLAQIILHEVCHALVQGEDSFSSPDWGLPTEESSEEYQAEGALREQACLRVQAALLRRHGLRQVLAPTTSFRAFYDALPEDPLDLPEGDPALALCRDALALSARPPFDPALHEVLARTAEVHALVAAHAAGTLWGLPPAQRHPAGPPLSGAATCGECAWARPGKAALRCQRTGRRVLAGWRSCVLFEGPLDCRRCAACCRHGYDLVPLGRGEALSRRRPDLVQTEGIRRVLRQGRQCAALSRDEEGWGCTVYEDRPRACSDLPVGSAACLTARRRVGLSV